jgi:hypothetical protein
MNKKIIALDGLAAGKTEFVKIISLDYWRWNINFRNLLSFLSHKLFWDGNRNKNYYEFLGEFEVLVNKYFNSENLYIAEMIEKLMENDRLQILIIHNSKPEIRQELKKLYPSEFLSVLISDTEENNPDYDIVLNYKGEQYKQNVLSLFSTLEKMEIKEG